MTALTGEQGRTILIIGRSGQLARCLARQQRPAGWELIAMGREEGCDIADTASLAAQLNALRPDLVVNASAYTAVDKAESERDAAYRINAEGPGALAALCADLGLPLIHFSTDYVFDGSKPGHYVEDDAISPLNVYGASKAAGEAAIRAAHSLHVILRTSWVYSPFGANFVKTMLRLGEIKSELRIVGDQHGAPTAADDLARATMTIAQGIFAGRAHYGTYHVAAGGETNWAGFAREVFRLAGTGRGSPRVTVIRTEDYPTAAARPKNSRLSCEKIAQDYGIRLPAWSISLEPCVRELSALEIVSR